MIKQKTNQKKKTNHLKKENEEKVNEGLEVTQTESEPTAEEIVNAISAESKVDLSELMINEETDRLLERFINQIKQLNLNVDSLLKAQNKTYDDLLQDHKKIAENNIKSEFRATSKPWKP